ncbi:glycosyltransferase family 4 protein [Peribacillus frigoritolerans]|uniref:glycosyltransferase family 4 protein n=1 Tax=Peribacillus frigoritolerans TaxID=450367 RepID=UPI003305723F
MFKILVDARMIRSSGIGVYINNLLQIILGDNRNYQFSLLGAKEDLNHFSNFRNVSIIDCNVSIYSIKEQIELIKVISTGYDLVWSPHYNIPIFTSANTKLLVTIHDIFHLKHDINQNSISKKLYANFMFRSLSKKADKIICVSKFTKNELMKKVNVKSTSKIEVIYNGVDSEWFKQSRKKREPYIIYVGNVKPHKNLTNLISAFKLVYNDIPHNLIIIGKKEGFITSDNFVIESAAELGNRVVFTGYLEDNEMRQMVSDADFMVYPSIYEGFGLPPLEAMACGCPVIASEIASIPEVCGDNVEYINPFDIKDIANKLVFLANNSQRKLELSNKGLAHSRGFNWKQSSEDTLKVIREVLEQ